MMHRFSIHWAIATPVPRQVLQVWKDEFDVAYDEGTTFVLTMHPHVIGHRSRIVVLRELLELHSPEGRCLVRHARGCGALGPCNRREWNDMTPQATLCICLRRIGCADRTCPPAPGLSRRQDQ